MATNADIPATLSESFALTPVDSNGTYISKHSPGSMGNSSPIAFGGCTIAIALNGAYQSLPPTHHLYSAQGNFLGPALTDRPYHLRVKTYRQTKSFITRSVEVSQLQDDGTPRLCMVIIADFQCHEPRTLLSYSKKPRHVYSKPTDCRISAELREDFLARGQISKPVAAAHAKSFGLMARYFESRLCPEGVFAQNLMGIAKQLPTSQDDLPLHERTSGDWLRARHPLPSEADNATALGWITDAAVAFMPLSHNGMFLDDAGACSTLDFSLRVMVERLDLGKWHLRELRTNAGGGARTFSECDVWDEGGRLVASMSQQCVLRPKL